MDVIGSGFLFLSVSWKYGAGHFFHAQLFSDGVIQWPFNQRIEM